MSIKIKHTNPSLNEFSTNDLIVNVQSGSLWFKSNTDLFKIQGDNVGYDVVSGSFTNFDGIVGIGTDDPDELLHLFSTVNNGAVLTIESSASNSYPFLSLKNDVREYQVTAHGGLSDAFTIYDGTAGAHRLTIASDGKVGIGETQPYEKLEVAGNIMAADGGVLAGINGDKDGFIFHDLYTAGGNYYGYNNNDSGQLLNVVSIVSKENRIDDFLFLSPLSNMVFTFKKRYTIQGIQTGIFNNDGSPAVIDENSTVIYKIKKAQIQ